MKITVLTLFPAMVERFVSESIIQRARDKGHVEIEFINLRDYAIDAYKSVDDRPYGGGAGMVMRIEPVDKAMAVALQGSSEEARRHIVCTSAKGRRYTQRVAEEFTKLDHLIILAGHYEGYDERVMDVVDEELSVGDFVMTGGEIAAAAIIDSVVRLLPGVLKKDEATEQESFFRVPLKELITAVGTNEVLEELSRKGVSDVQLLEYPHYTRPEEYKGKKVPEILLSGNHREIYLWRLRKAFEVTCARRPDLLSS